MAQLKPTDTLWQLIATTVEPMGYELVSVELIQHGRRRTLRVYIDTANGIMLQDCEIISHQLSGVLDVEQPLEGAYDLEISSPGLDRPLSKPSDFERFVGNTIKIRLIVPMAGQRNFTGVLRGIEDGIIQLDTEQETYSLALQHIEKARLVPETV